MHERLNSNGGQGTRFKYIPSPKRPFHSILKIVSTIFVLLGYIFQAVPSVEALIKTPNNRTFPANHYKRFANITIDITRQQRLYSKYLTSINTSSIVNSGASDVHEPIEADIVDPKTPELRRFHKVMQTFRKQKLDLVGFVHVNTRVSDWQVNLHRQLMTMAGFQPRQRIIPDYKNYSSIVWNVGAPSIPNLMQDMSELYVTFQSQYDGYDSKRYEIEFATLQAILFRDPVWSPRYQKKVILLKNHSLPMITPASSYSILQPRRYCQILAQRRSSVPFNSVIPPHSKTIVLSVTGSLVGFKFETDLLTLEYPSICLQAILSSDANNVNNKHKISKLKQKEKQTQALRNICGIHYDPLLSAINGVTWFSSCNHLVNTDEVMPVKQIKLISSFNEKHIIKWVNARMELDRTPISVCGLSQEKIRPYYLLLYDESIPREDNDLCKAAANYVMPEVDSIHRHMSLPEKFLPIAPSKDWNILLYIVYHDDKSKEIAWFYHYLFPYFTLPVRVRSTVFFESIMYRDELPLRYEEWREKQYVGMLSYKVMAAIHTNLFQFFEDLQFIPVSTMTKRRKKQTPVVYPFVPLAVFPDMQHSMVMQAMHAHGKYTFLPAWTAILRAMNFKEAVIQQSFQLRGFFRNAIICRPDIMSNMMKLMNYAIELAMFNTTITKLLHKNARYNGLAQSEEIFNKPYYELHPFVFERLPVVFIHYLNITPIYFGKNDTNLFSTIPNESARNRHDNSNSSFAAFKLAFSKRFSSGEKNLTDPNRMKTKPDRIKI